MVTVEELWGQAQAALAGAGIPVFPGLPGRHGSPRLEVVLWPDDEDPAGFVNFAGRVRPPVVYAAADHFGPEELDDFGRRLGAIPAAGDLLAEVRGRFGDLWRAAVAFVADGVLHVWEVVAPWYEDLEEQAAALEDSVRMAEADSWQRQLIDLAATIAGDGRFAKARNEADRLAVVAELRPESELWPASVRAEVIGRAKRIFATDVLPGLERDIAERARRLMGDGLTRRQAARSLDMGDDRLARLLARHPAAGHLGADRGGDPEALAK